MFGINANIGKNYLLLLNLKLLRPELTVCVLLVLVLVLVRVLVLVLVLVLVPFGT